MAHAGKIKKGRISRKASKKDFKRKALRQHPMNTAILRGGIDL